MYRAVFDRIKGCCLTYHWKFLTKVCYRLFTKMLNNHINLWKIGILWPLLRAKITIQKYYYASFRAVVLNHIPGGPPTLHILHVSLIKHLIQVTCSLVETHRLEMSQTKETWKMCSVGGPPGMLLRTTALGVKKVQRCLFEGPAPVTGFCIPKGNIFEKKNLTVHNNIFSREKLSFHIKIYQHIWFCL